MYSREDIVKMVRIKVIDTGVDHISDMLEGIQNYIFYRKPTSKFMQLCADENWEYAAGIADRMNKEILTKTTLFQDFVKGVKTSPEYISKIREGKLNIIFEK